MKGKYAQTEFRDGDIVYTAKLKGKEIVSAYYILTKAEIGDNVRMITSKLPAWVEYKNDIKGIVKKLERLEIIKMWDSPGGKRITEISGEAVLIAKDFMNDFKKYKELLNDLAEGSRLFPYKYFQDVRSADLC